MTVSGQVPFLEWLEQLKNDQARHRIEMHLDKLRLGNLGDWKAVGGQVFESRLNYGPGYRIYFSFDRDELILLLCAGDKSSQARDIMKARHYWADYKERRNGKT